MFKECPKCHYQWKTREDLLNDSSLYIIGYQVNFQNLKLGHFLYNHSCKTTLAIRANEFTDLYNGPVFKKRLTGTDECQGFCKQKFNLQKCFSECECAYIREVLSILANLNRN